MRKILLYHGFREGKLHKVRAEEGTFYEPGELDSRIFDTHPGDEELKEISQETQRAELDKDRKVEV